MEELKENIVNDIDCLENEQKEKEFIENFIKLWRSVIEDFSKENYEKKIILLGTTYYSIEKDLCNMQKIYNFIELIIKYKYLDEEIKLCIDMYKQSMESLELYINAGVFIGYILEQLKIRENEDYYETILDIYVNAPNIVEKDCQILAVSKLLELDIPETIIAIQNYTNDIIDNDSFNFNYDNDYSDYDNNKFDN